ncbi:type IV pilus modification PilV family protein [Deinococcus ruber]|uniref:Uncharacterized protein n=1 Tax=Deinococcus ruber TaxID=1848197 RepID=A0A918FF43_9DEIO|nr:hypothetical protein [Deinococcus ruber]GGR32636.1 hypothetical protein GCM10008957_48870 [Deinococcus ruber]
MHRPERTLGITTIEVLISVAVALLAVTSFAIVVTQSARTTGTAFLSTYAVRAVQAVAHNIQQGNPAYTTALTLTAEDLQSVLSSQENRRADLRPALSGTIQPLGGDPPTYRVQVGDGDFTQSATVTAPGGTP